MMILWIFRIAKDTESTIFFSLTKSLPCFITFFSPLFLLNFYSRIAHCGTHVPIFGPAKIRHFFVSTIYIAKISPPFGPIFRHFSPLLPFWVILFSYTFTKTICANYYKRAGAATNRYTSMNYKIINRNLFFYSILFTLSKNL